MNVLYAGQNIEAETVEIGNDEDFYVTLSTKEGWLLQYIYVYLGLLYCATLSIIHGSRGELF